MIPLKHIALYESLSDFSDNFFYAIYTYEDETWRSWPFTKMEMMNSQSNSFNELLSNGNLSKTFFLFRALKKSR